MFSGRRQPSCDGTSRMTRECQVRICERLGVKFPGPTRQSATWPAGEDTSVKNTEADLCWPNWLVSNVREAALRG